MKEECFRLGEYKIISHDSGGLTWERHCGLGERREGRCFRKGSLLVLGPARGCRPGYLKLEYLLHLKKLPEWTATRYYSTCPDLYHCSTGKAVSLQEMRLWEPDRQTGWRGTRPASGARNGALDDHGKEPPALAVFRLERFEITCGDSGRIFWRACAGSRLQRKGNCTILEDILFLGPSRQLSADADKGKFLSDLKRLPPWDRTTYFCPKHSLRTCRAAGTPRFGARMDAAAVARTPRTVAALQTSGGFLRKTLRAARRKGGDTVSPGRSRPSERSDNRITRGRNHILGLFQGLYSKKSFFHHRLPGIVLEAAAGTRRRFPPVLSRLLKRLSHFRLASVSQSVSKIWRRFRLRCRLPWRQRFR